MDQVCDISPFLNECDLMPNVEVYAAAKAWDGPIMNHISILEFQKELWLALNYGTP